MRKALGAGKRKLIIQFIGESLVITSIAAAVSLIIISLSLPAFNLLMHKQLSLHLGTLSHTTGLLFITIICGFIAGSYPSIYLSSYLSSFNPAFVLKGLKTKTGSAPLIRKGLVVFQFTISVVFIISTVIFYMQIQHVKNRSLGFNKNNLIEINPGNDI